MKGGWTVGEAEEHDLGFEKPTVSSEGRLPFITFLHPEIVETPTDVKLSEVSGPPELIN